MPGTCREWRNRIPDFPIFMLIMKKKKTEPHKYIHSETHTLPIFWEMGTAHFVWVTQQWIQPWLWSDPRAACSLSLGVTGVKGKLCDNVHQCKSLCIAPCVGSGPCGERRCWGRREATAEITQCMCTVCSTHHMAGGFFVKVFCLQSGC